MALLGFLHQLAWLTQLVQLDHLARGILAHHHHSGFHAFHAAFFKVELLSLCSISIYAYVYQNSLLWKSKLYRMAYEHFGKFWQNIDECNWYIEESYAYSHGRECF